MLCILFALCFSSLWFQQVVVGGYESYTSWVYNLKTGIYLQHPLEYSAPDKIDMYLRTHSLSTWSQGADIYALWSRKLTFFVCRSFVGRRTGFRCYLESWIIARFLEYWSWYVCRSNLLLIINWLDVMMNHLDTLEETAAPADDAEDEDEVGMFSENEQLHRWAAYNICVPHACPASCW